MRRVISSLSRACRGMTMPMMKAPKMNAMLISCVTYADRSTPTMIAANHPLGIRPTSSYAVAMRARTRRTTSTMNRVKAAASAIVLTTSPNVPDAATAVASAIKNQAVTSSIAAHAIVSAPTGRLIIRRSARMRASTGNAVIDIETPMNNANATNFLSGPSTL